MTEAQIRAFLKRLSVWIQTGRFILTRYARERAAAELSWEVNDILMQLQELAVADFYRVEDSREHPGRVVWVFCPEYWEGGLLWIRLIEVDHLIVISFHRENTHEA